MPTFALLCLLRLLAVGAEDDNRPAVPELLYGSQTQYPIWVSLDAINQNGVDPNYPHNEVVWDNRPIALMPSAECDETTMIYDHFGWIERRPESVEELLTNEQPILRFEIVHSTPGFYTGMPAFMLQLRTEWMSESAFRKYGWRSYFNAALLEGSFRQGDQYQCWNQLGDGELALQSLTVGSDVLYLPLHEAYGHEALEFVYAEEIFARGQDGTELIPDELSKSSPSPLSFEVIEKVVRSSLRQVVQPEDFD